MEIAYSCSQEIIMNKIAKLYPFLKVKEIIQNGDEYVADIQYDANIPGSCHNQKWIVENDKAVFLGIIFKQAAHL
ncbi:MAG: hypothetical protein NVS1B13_25460 [Flavisolibacter sp.]